MKINVKKRDGRLEPLDLNKVHKVVAWAAEGLDVSPSQVELKSHVQFHEGITTESIHEMLIKSAADLISEENPDYQYMASRLSLFHLRKIAYGEYTPPKLFDHIVKLTQEGWYDSSILASYTKVEIDELDDVLDHNKDLNIAYAGIKQLEGKYLVQHRREKRVKETPNMAFMVIAMMGFIDEDKEKRIDLVKDFYKGLADFDISLPTPIMGGLRTGVRQYSSCTVISSDDSLDSINATSNAIVKYISQRAGIGVNGGKIRALGSDIRGGEAVHTGVIPFWKVFQAAVKSCSQGALRGGAATLYYPLWHLEAESLLVLKNNKGVEENRIRQLDYGVQINKLLYTRLIKDQDITLFSPNAVPGMYDAFFADQEEFERLYTEAEKNPLIVQKKVPAKELFSLLLQERAATGRIYIQNVDHCNTHSAFDPKQAPITMSNLCVSGDTKVLVKINCTVQNVEIKSLVDRTVLAWNGEEFSETYFTQTSPLAKLWKVTLEDVESGEATTIYATKEHRWVDTVENIEYRTFELEEGMVFEGTTDNLNQTWNKVISVEEDVKEEATYCGREPKLGLLTFNGIITGNCLEITLPTKPLNDINDPDGEISLCTLAGINLGTLPKWDAREEFLLEVKRRMYLLVRFLDNLLSYQEYPIPAARTATEKYRSLGIGPINYAYFLAKNGKRFIDGSGIEITHQLFEAMQYFGLEASNELAKERGTCEAFDSTTYSQGLLPINTYKKDIDSFAKVDYQLDWEQLRTSIKEHGLRNATITTVFPSETSSQVSNATNGIDPARGLITVKASKDGILKQVVPEIKTLKHQYDLLWDIPDNECFFKLVATMQKFVDQAISMNTHYDPKRFTNGKVPMVQLIKDMLTGYKYGIKTFYYHHTRDGADDTQSDIDDGCAGGACKL